MELLSTLILFSFFSFLYHLGWSDDDFILELIGGIGFFIIGLIVWGSGLQLSAIVSPSSGVFELTLQTVPSGSAFGIVMSVFSAILLLYTGNTIIKMRASMRGE